MVVMDALCKHRHIYLLVFYNVVTDISFFISTPPPPPSTGLSDGTLSSATDTVPRSGGECLQGVKMVIRVQGGCCYHSDVGEVVTIVMWEGFCYHSDVGGVLLPFMYTCPHRLQHTITITLHPHHPHHTYQDVQFWCSLHKHTGSHW